MDELRPLSDDDRDPLARLVQHGRRLEVEYDVEAGLARHQQAIASGATPRAAARPKWGWLAMTTVVVGAGWLATRPPTAAPDVAPRVVEIRDAAAIEAPSIARAPTIEAKTSSAVATTSAPPVIAPTRPRPSAPRTAKVREMAPAATPEVTDTDRIEREAAQVRRIRGDLGAGRAAAALRGCDEGDHEFASGVFAPEREGLRVLALFALDRRDEAERAAARYLDAHPNGPLVSKIRAARG